MINIKDLQIGDWYKRTDYKQDEIAKSIVDALLYKCIIEKIKEL